MNMENIIYRNDLDAVVLGGCNSPDCDHLNHDELYLHCHCNAGGRIEASYRLGSGIVRIGCRECGETMANIAVRQQSDEPMMAGY